MKKVFLLAIVLTALSVSSAFFLVKVVDAFALDTVSTEAEKKQAEIETPKTNLTQFNSQNLDSLLYVIYFQMTGPGKGATKGSADAGAFGAVSNMISFTYTKPADTQSYVADVLQNMNIIAPPVYAQGLGFSALQPVLALWKIFRNIAYVFFVFIFLIIGFAIMFRQNLGGQTAVTVQQALPRIIVALLAVSFSYAIAGLMIDLMWLSMYFLITIFSGANLLPVSYTNNFSILNMNIFDVFTNTLSNGFATNSGALIGDFVKNMLNADPNLGNSNALANFAGGITNILATLILFVAVLYAMFKTFFALIKVYLEIILSIVFAPLILMMGAINGNAFGNWLKGLIANLAVFPVLLVFIIVGFMLINVGNDASISKLGEAGFVPPFVPGRSQAKTVGLAGGIAAIMLLPEVTAIMGKFKPQSIFEEFGGKAWENAMRGKEAGLRMGFGAARAPVGAAIGYYNREKFGLGGSPAKGAAAALIGGATAAYGPGRAARLGGRALSQYGEFAENLPGVAAAGEEFVARQAANYGIAPIITNINRLRVGRGVAPIATNNPRVRAIEEPPLGQVASPFTTQPGAEPPTRAQQQTNANRGGSNDVET